MKITEPTTFEEKTVKDLHTLDPFLHTVCNSRYSIRNKSFLNVHKSFSLNLDLSFSLLLYSPQYGDVQLQSLELEKETPSGLHPVTNVVNPAIKSHMHTSALNVVAQKKVSGTVQTLNPLHYLCSILFVPLTVSQSYSNIYPAGLLHRYKLTFYATYGTAETQMLCFDGVARQIIGKPCELLIRSMNTSGDTPSDLHRIIGLKFTFAINMNINSYYSKVSTRS
jgi:hypothetical protein